MGLALYKVIPFGVIAGFGGGAVFYFLGDQELAKKLLLMGAIAGLSWGFIGVMMSQYKFLFSTIWCLVLGGMLARVTIWKDIKPDSIETSVLIKVIDQNWNLIVAGLIAYGVIYAITWGQRIDGTIQRRTSRPIYPTFPHERSAGGSEEKAPATGETIVQPVVQAPPQRENLMQRRIRHMKIRRLLEQDRDAEAVQLLRRGEYIAGGDVESEYD